MASNSLQPKMETTKCPLKDADCAALRAIVERAKARLEYAAKLDALGIDVAELKAQNEAQIQFCQSCLDNIAELKL
jgi:hypothetical protein